MGLYSRTLTLPPLGMRHASAEAAMKILPIEDDEAQLQVLTQALTRQRYVVDSPTAGGLKQQDAVYSVLLSI